MSKYICTALLCLALVGSPLAESAIPAQAILRWTDLINSPPVSYNVYKYNGRCTSSLLFTRIATVNVTTYTDFNVSSGRTYCYFVTATDGFSESPPSSSASISFPRGRK